jgi:DNA repair exonuclease SbcCD ATPase subunit
MRITRLKLRDLKRYRDLQIELAPGLTLVRGPNEAGKTTIARAIELALTGSVVSEQSDLDALRSWDAAPAARPTVAIEFTDDSTGAERQGTIQKSFGPGGSAVLTLDGEKTTDPASVDQILADLTGIPTPSFFRSTALVDHGELEDLDRDEATLRERLSASISAADRSTAAAIAELERTLADLNTRGERDPGRLRIAEEAVGRSRTIVEAGEASLARLVAEREALGIAELARETVSAALARHKELLDQARRAEVLTAEHAAATERHERYAEAIEVADALTALHFSHPSTEPLPILRQAVERLRTLNARIVELTGMLSGEIEVTYEVTVAKDTWRPLSILAFLAIAAGLGLAVLGQALAGMALLGPVGIAVVVLGGVLAFVGRRRRTTAGRVERQHELADVEIDRRLRGRSQMEAELRQAQADTKVQLEGLGLTDLAAAEDLLARQEAHTASITELDAKLAGLVGREPVETLPALRDAAGHEVDQKTAALDALEPETREAGASGRLVASVKQAEADLEAARTAEATARAQVRANPVDATQVVGEAERLAIWEEQLALLQRRARVCEAALAGLERATSATVLRATRYLEQRMIEGVSLITEGRYRRVRIDDRTLDIQLVSPEKADWVDVRALSAGTLAQVYLVARLGLVRHLTGDRRPPLVLDDPFVSFDDLRAARAFSLLRELTRDLQVVFLTSTDRYDAAADAIVELPGPTGVDAGAGAPAAAKSA